MVADLEGCALHEGSVRTLLVGTRKDGDAEFSVGAVDVDGLSLLISERLGPLAAGLVHNEEEGLCFFCIENSRGLRGDPVDPKARPGDPTVSVEHSAAGTLTRPAT